MLEAEPLELAQPVASLGCPIAACLIAARPLAAALRHAAVAAPADAAPRAARAPGSVCRAWLSRRLWRAAAAAARLRARPAGRCRQAIRSWIVRGGAAGGDRRSYRHRAAVLPQPAIVASSRPWTSARAAPAPTSSPMPRTSVSPTAWSTAWLAWRRPPPSSTTARPRARASTPAHGRRMRDMHRSDQRRPRQDAARWRSEQVAGPAQPAHHARRTARRRRRRPRPPPPAPGPRPRPPQARPGPAPRRTAPASPPQARVGGLALQHGDALARPRARCRRLWPRHWPMSVSRAVVGRPAPWATPTMLRASARACSRRRHEGARAASSRPSPAPAGPPASFLARIEAVISGMLSTVAVTSRMA